MTKTKLQKVREAVQSGRVHEMMATRLKFKSKAQWPAGGCCVNISEDTHDTREQAQAVCDMLVSGGWGGDCEVFPVRVWVEEVE